MNRPGDAIDRRTPYEDLPEYLSPEECQMYLGISRTTMYDLLRRRALPHLQLGRLKRIPKTALLATLTPVSSRTVE